MSIPVIIPFMHSLNRDEELRYALRSLDQRITGTGEVIIIGDKPAWPHQNLTILECENAFKDDRYRDNNIYFKMKLGFERVKDRALVMHDDNFFLMYSAVEDWPWYVSQWPQLTGGLYNEVIKRTVKTIADSLDKSGMQPIWPYSDIHCAHVINKKNFTLLSAYNWTAPYGYCIKTMCSLSIDGIEKVVDIEDCKLKAYYPAEEIKEMIKGRPWFSAADNAFGGGGLLSVLKELYPEPSKYEV